MMRNLFLSVFIAFFIALPASAQPDDGLRGGSSSGGECNWDEFLERLGRQETGFVCGGTGGPCDRQYVTLSPRADDPSWGKWQFTPSKWREMTSERYPQCQGQAAAISRECWPVQRWATIKNMEQAIEFFERNNWCGSKLGQDITGTHQGTTLSCKVNKSGLLSAYHNAQGNACNFVAGSSRWTSQINWRVCDAKNIPFPEHCTPEESDPTVPFNFTPNGTPYIMEPDEGFDHPNHIKYTIEVLREQWVASLQLMATQLSTVMMQQVHAVGKFFDAKHQLELQRLMQQKYARAHKDYHPSEQMCEIGTFSRDLLNAEQRAKLTKTAITEDLMDRSLASGDTLTKQGNISDRKSRLKQYIETFCNTEDNARNNSLLCETSGDIDQQNMDIDYTRLIDVPLTLDVDLTTTGGSTAAAIKEEKTETNLFAFLNYIFMHDTLPTVGRAKTTLEKFVVPYEDARSLVAMRSVAYNSFAHIIAMKTAGPKTSASSSEPAGPYLKALMREMGMGDEEITDFLGDNPSYYAQMEVLTKKIYQDPTFVANLYDKPANVRRIRAAMTAIKLMQDRDIHEALMRREMLISMIVELQLRQKQDKLTDKINNMIGLPEKDGKPLIPTSTP